MSRDDRFPQGEEFRQHIAKRHRRGKIWRSMYLASTVTAILFLVALLYNVVNQAFGLVAVQNTVTPQSLALLYQEERLLEQPNSVALGDYERIVEAVAADRNAIGLVGYAYFGDNQERLRSVAIDGVQPSAATVHDGSYPLTRPLYIYTSVEGLRDDAAVLAFADYYLQQVNTVTEEVGYFSVDDAALAEMRAELAAIGGGASAADAVSGDITIVGSSTVLPLTRRMADAFAVAGFGSSIAVESTGSVDGFRRFCSDRSIDIVNASRPMNQAERTACEKRGRRPVALQVGLDAVTVIVNNDNDAVQEASIAELGRLFVEAETWQAVDAQWPAEPVNRYLPNGDSGTLEFFAGAVFEMDLAELPKEALIAILDSTIPAQAKRVMELKGRFYADRLIFQTEQQFAEVCNVRRSDPLQACVSSAVRSRNNVYQILVENIIQPRVLATWSMSESLTQRQEIEQLIAAEYPDAEVEFRAWLTGDFIANPQSSTAEVAGVRTALFGSLWVIAITMFFSFPIGVGAALFLEEYASPTNVFSRIIQTNISNLAGVPSIIYGLLGVAIFVRTMEALTSGQAFGTATPNGRTVISAGLTLGLLILPIIIISAQEAIRAVPSSLRQASYGLGATKWQTIWNHVLPNAVSGILTGTILAMSRAVGETAPLVVVGASTAIFVDPNSPFSKFTVLPIQIYQWTSRPQGEFQHIAAAAIIVLLALLLTLNATAIVLRNRFSKRMG